MRVGLEREASRVQRVTRMQHGADACLSAADMALDPTLGETGSCKRLARRCLPDAASLMLPIASLTSRSHSVLRETGSIGTR